LHFTFLINHSFVRDWLREGTFWRNRCAVSIPASSQNDANRVTPIARPSRKHLTCIVPPSARHYLQSTADSSANQTVERRNVTISLQRGRSPSASYSLARAHLPTLSNPVAPSHKRHSHRQKWNLHRA